MSKTETTTESSAALVDESSAALVEPPVASVTSIKSATDVVSSAKFRVRHAGLIISFIMLVVIPTLLVLVYMYQIANDQYSSRVSFSIRSEESQSPLDALGSLGQLSTGASSDASILNEYLRSQKVVEDVGEFVDLRAMYSKPENDPFFSFDPSLPIEDLLTYFQRMNYVTFDSGNGLLDIESFAFSPEDARNVATVITDVSRQLVERLSAIAQDDTTKLSKFELERSRDRLLQARLSLSELRGREQIVDPRSDLASQMGVLTALQNQMASAMVELDLLVSTSQSDDPRVISVKQKIKVINHRIDEERNKVGQKTLSSESSLASIVGEFESLMSDLAFAEAAYLSANANYDAALSEARRRSKYLAAHIPPTLAQSSQYPNRPLWVFCVFGICLLIWSVLTLTVYAMLDRR